MSPKTRNIRISITAILAAAVVVGGWMVNNAPKVASALDRRYVHTDSFAIHQQGEALVHQRDSLVIDARLTRIDTSLGMLVRDCQRRGGCR